MMARPAGRSWPSGVPRAVSVRSKRVLRPGANAGRLNAKSSAKRERYADVVRLQAKQADAIKPLTQGAALVRLSPLNEDWTHPSIHQRQGRERQEGGDQITIGGGLWMTSDTGEQDSSVLRAIVGLNSSQPGTRVLLCAH
jgi:hypothetical protein